MKSIPAELSKPLTIEDVRKIFGFTKPEELGELLRKCPRHYIRTYYAQIYLGSPQNTNDIRSNNDGYLRNQIIRAIEGAGIILGGVSKGGKKSQQPSYKDSSFAEKQGGPAQSPLTPPLPKPATQKSKSAARNVIYLQANGSLAGCSPAQPKQEKFLESLTGNGVTFDSKNATKGVQGNSLPNFSETDVAARPSISQPGRSVVQGEGQRADAESHHSAEGYHHVLMNLMVANRRQAALQNSAMMQSSAGPYPARTGYPRPNQQEPMGSFPQSRNLPNWRHVIHRQAELRMLNSLIQAMPQLQQLGRLDPQVMAGVLQAQPQLISHMHQQAASQQLLQAMAMQMQMPETPRISVPTPVAACTSVNKPPRRSETGFITEVKALQPQISLEAAKVQQLGASLGAKLRPESAQKIQDEAAAKVQSEFFRGDFEEMLQPSEPKRTTSHSCSEPGSKLRGGRRRDQMDRDTAESLSTRDLSGSTSVALPSTLAIPRPGSSGGTEAWSSPDLPGRPIAVPSILWQPYQRHADGDQTLVMNLANPTAAHSPSTSPEPHLAGQTGRGHSRSEADLVDLALGRRSGRKQTRGRRRPRSQQRDRQESAFTRVGPKIRSPKKRPSRAGQASKLLPRPQSLAITGTHFDGVTVEQQPAFEQRNILFTGPDEGGAGTETSAFAALLDAAEAMQMEETSVEE